MKSLSTGSIKAGSVFINGQQYRTAIFNLSSANILAMNATPVTVLAAPPTGYVYDGFTITFSFTVGTQYASGGIVTFQYTGGAVVHQGSIAAATVNGAASFVSTLAPATGTALSATAITITNATGAFTTGTGTAKIMLAFKVVKI